MMSIIAVTVWQTCSHPVALAGKPQAQNEPSKEMLLIPTLSPQTENAANHKIQTRVAVTSVPSIDS